MCLLQRCGLSLVSSTPKKWRLTRWPFQKRTPQGQFRGPPAYTHQVWRRSVKGPRRSRGTHKQTDRQTLLDIYSMIFAAADILLHVTWYCLIRKCHSHMYPIIMSKIVTVIVCAGSQAQLHCNQSHCWCYNTWGRCVSSNSWTEVLTLKVLNFWKFTSYCSLKPLWSGMGEVVPARTSPTLHPPSPPTVHQLSWLAL